MEKQLQFGNDGLTLTNMAIKRVYFMVTFEFDPNIPGQENLINLNAVTANITANIGGMQDTTGFNLLPMAVVQQWYQRNNSVNNIVTLNGVVPTDVLIKTDPELNAVQTGFTIVPLLNEIYLTTNDTLQIKINSLDFLTTNKNKTQIYLIVEESSDVIPLGFKLPKFTSLVAGQITQSFSINNSSFCAVLCTKSEKELSIDLGLSGNVTPALLIANQITINSNVFSDTLFERQQIQNLFLHTEISSGNRFYETQLLPIYVRHQTPLDKVSIQLTCNSWVGGYQYFYYEQFYCNDELTLQWKSREEKIAMRKAQSLLA